MSYGLPTTIRIGDKDHNIRNKGDYRMVLDCFKALNDIEMSKDYRIATAIVIFYEDCNSIDDIYSVFGQNYATAVEKMFDFFNTNQPNVGVRCHFKLIDWDNDSQMICAAVNSVAHTEVRSLEYAHWFTFMGWFMSVSESVLATVVEIRNKIMTGQKMEKYEQKFRKENPHYFMWNSKTPEQIEEENEIMALWNAG